MSGEILVNVSPYETRVAKLNNGVLQDLYFERNNKRGVMNNIYIGKVARVMPGMEAAFVDIGLERTAFLHINDVVQANGKSINELLCENQQLLVQVIKEPLGSKGARLSTNISIAARFLVLLPFDKGLLLSNRIESEPERARLQALLAPIYEHKNVGCIIRTVAEGVHSEHLIRDAQFLDKLWQAISERISQGKIGEVVYEDLQLSKRLLRDIATDKIERIRVDKPEVLQEMREFARRYAPNTFAQLELHDASVCPIFELYNVEDEILKALNRKVELKSGGHVVIDQTESMTTIDVNTGSFVGSRNLEQTSFRTNLEAAQTIARQLRLRNLGGIIIIDFIDMRDSEHRRQVLRALEKQLEKDNAYTKVFGASALGLVQMTRKRTRESLEQQMCELCTTCHGTGFIRTIETVSYEIYREILRLTRNFDATEVLVLAAQIVIDFLLDEQREAWSELQEIANIRIRFQVESLYAQDQYDVVMR